MSNFQKQKGQYELPSDLIEEFLSAHDFIGTEINYYKGVTTLKNTNTKHYVDVPTKRSLSRTQIEKCLIDAGLTFEDLDAYIEHLKTINRFDAIIDLSLKRPSNKKSES